MYVSCINLHTHATVFPQALLRNEEINFKVIGRAASNNNNEEVTCQVAQGRCSTQKLVCEN